jgi:hypothetical protein
MADPLKVGSRWRSAVCDTEVIVVRNGGEPLLLECGGAAMLPSEADEAPKGTPDPAWSGGTLIGKRYVMEGSDVELLCTKGGAGSLSISGTALEVKSSKPLPSSD